MNALQVDGVRLTMLRLKAWWRRRFGLPCDPAELNRQKAARLVEIIVNQALSIHGIEQVRVTCMCDSHEIVEGATEFACTIKRAPSLPPLRARKVFEEPAYDFRDEREATNAACQFAQESLDYMAEHMHECSAMYGVHVSEDNNQEWLP